MKKALFLSFALLVWVTTALRAAPANANFSAERGVPFQLVFDGQPLARAGTRQVHLDRLSPGFHWAEFWVPTGYGRVVSFRTRVLLDPGLETSYVLLLRPYGLQLRKVAEVPIRRGYGYGEPAPYPPALPPPPAPDGRYGTPPLPPSNGGAPAGSAYPPAETYPPGDASTDAPYQRLDVSMLNRLLQAMHRVAADDDKLRVARQALAQSAIRSEDLLRLLNTLSVEGARLDLTKYAYAHVVDPQNFGRVYEAFELESSVQELQRFIKQDE